MSINRPPIDNENPKITAPALFVFLGAAALQLQKFINYEKAPALYSLVVLTGIVFLGVASLLGFRYLAWMTLSIVEHARIAWAAPRIRLMELLGYLTDPQIDFAREVGIVYGVILIDNDRKLRWKYVTPWGEIDPSWLQQHLKKAFEFYPEMPAVRRLGSGSTERNLEEAFNEWMVDWGLAERRPGRRFRWLATQHKVYDALGLNWAEVNSETDD